MLSLREVTVRFGDLLAVDDVSLDLPRGRVLAVLGPSGCGKSTLLRAVAGLEELAAGTVSVDGRGLAGVPTHRRGFALMFQDGQLFPQQSVGANISYPLRLRGVTRRERDARVAELLELVGLPGYADRSPGTLSGGEQQRVALARALAAEPRLLLLDEPLSALDRSLRERLAVDLRQILTTTGTTALLVTHDHDEAFTIADEMAVMLSGRVVQHGPTAEVWRSPATEEVARFLGYRTVLEGSAADRVAAVLGGRRGADGIRLALRRSAIRVDGEGRLDATVRTAAAAVDALRVVLDVDGIGRLEGLADEGAQLSPGERVRVRVEPTGVAQLFGDTRAGSEGLAQ